MSGAEGLPAYADFIEAHSIPGVAGELQRASLEGVLAGREADPHGVVGYFGTIGFPNEIRALGDLMQINEDQDDWSAHRVREGVLLANAADQLWALLT